MNGKIDHALAKVKNNEWLLLQNIPIKEKSKLLKAVILICVGSGLMLWGSLAEKKSVQPVADVPVKALNLTESTERWSESRLEREVAAILTQVRGAGRVMVDINLAGTEETEWLYRENREERVIPQDQGGESREIKVQREPVFQRKSGGEESPISTRIKAPPITGVLVVVEGGENPEVCKELWEATAVLLGVPLHRVIVLPWKK